jgi:hypothetical protein
MVLHGRVAHHEQVAVHPGQDAVEEGPAVSVWTYSRCQKAESGCQKKSSRRWNVAESMGTTHVVSAQRANSSSAT